MTLIGIREPGQADTAAWKGAPQALTVVAVSFWKLPWELLQAP